MSRYYKSEDVIRRRAEDLADTSYWEYGNPKNVEEWLEVAEMEFKDLPTIEVSEDAISRAHLEKQLQQIEDITAMAHIDLGENPYDETEEITMPISTVRKIFKNAPSVIPKPKEGEWIESPYENADGMTMYRCSECGCLCEGGLNYCFKCGARMRDNNVETD